VGAEETLDQLVALSARAVGPVEGVLASSAAKHLVVIRGRVDRARETNYNWEKEFDWSRWATDIASARESLKQLSVATATSGKGDEPPPNG
jgi:hypothetical protein